MKSIKYQSLFYILFCLIVACNSHSQQQKEIDLLEQKILLTHDEVMPKIGMVLALRKQINLKIDSCQTKDCQEILQGVSFQLTKADADMMKWMHQYQKPLVHDTAIVYLKNQQVVIEQVKVQILSSIIAADSILNH